jgi:hypothetical protein
MAFSGEGWMEALVDNVLKKKKRKGKVFAVAGRERKGK